MSVGPVSEAEVPFGSAAHALDLAEYYDDVASDARREYDRHMAASVAATDLHTKQVAARFAELASCQARRARQWADAYRALAAECD